MKTALGEEAPVGQRDDQRQRELEQIEGRDHG